MCGNIQEEILKITENGSLLGTMEQYHITCNKCNKTIVSFSLLKQKEKS